jgi:hypothetical protein
VVDPRQGRAAVLAQRRLLAEEGRSEAVAASAGAPEAPVLGEIRDVLTRIEEMLRRQVDR